MRYFFVVFLAAETFFLTVAGFFFVVAGFLAVFVAGAFFFAGAAFFARVFSLDLAREALFLWITFFLAAVSIAL